MKLGLNLVRVRPDRIPALAARAEALGYESVFVPDHVVVPVAFDSRYPGTSDGSFPYGGDVPLFDPLVVLAMVAQATTRIRLGTAIYLLPLRHPLVTARTIATLDVLSGGRVILGVGVGWLAEELEALGIDPASRVGRAEEASVALRRLWTETEPSFEGRHFSFAPVHFEPKPLTRPHPPILFGGDSDAALRRALRFGDGWISGGVATTVAEVAALVGRLGELRSTMGEQGEPGAAAVGGDRAGARGADRFEITVLFPDPSPDDLDRLVSLGVDRVVAMPWDRSSAAPAAIERFGEAAAAVDGVEIGR